MQDVPPINLRQPNALPTLTAYLPAPKHATGAAMLVLPGGGYVMHATHEGEPVARWLVGLGIAAFVLHYRLAPQHRHPAMLDDAALAFDGIRNEQERWHVDPKRIGVLGFSAGGHLAALLATGAAPSAHPAVAILIYPVITFTQPHGHAWCRQCVLGDQPNPADVAALSAEQRVSATTSPTFLVHTADDDVTCQNSLLMAQALAAAGVPFALHLYERGGHGYGLATGVPELGGWPAECAAWLLGHLGGQGDMEKRRHGAETEGPGNKKQ